MIFLHPEYLFLILIPLLFLIFLIFTNKSQIDRYFPKEMAQRLKISDGSIGQKGRNIFLFISLVLMVVALARPVIPKGEVTIKSSTIDILVGIDVSKSMLANDIYPNRLEFAKKRVIEFMNSFKKARFGVVAFSSQGFLVSPLSEDTQTVEYLVKNLSVNSINQKGTDLFTPLELANRILKNDKQKILVLFTDGGDSKDFSKEIEFAKKNNIRVYIYAVGTKKGSTIKEGNSLMTDRNGNIVVVKLNSAIKELAVESKGAFIVGDYSGESIKKLEESIKESIKETSKREKKIKTYKELFYYPLLGALLFMLFGFSSLPKRKIGSSALAFLLVLGLFHATPAKASAFEFQDIKQAKEFYQNKQYKKAEDIYKKLLKDGKSEPQLLYDLANTLYKEKKYKEALEYYDKIKSDDPDLEFNKFYNRGNALAYMKKYDEAIKSYEKALKIKDDKDARYNLELLKKLKKQQKQNRNNKKKNNKKKNNKNKQGGNKNKNKQNKSGKNGKNKKQNSKNQNKNSGNKNKEQNSKNQNGQNKQNKQNKQKGDKNKKSDSKNRKNDKKRDKEKGQNGKKKQKPKKSDKKENGVVAGRVNKKIMSDAEEKKWTRMMLENRPKTLPLEIDSKIHKLQNSGNEW